MESNNLLHSIEQAPKDKKLIVFDLDGTLAESKTPIDEEVASLLIKLLKVKKVAVIGGGKYDLFRHQLTDKLETSGALLSNLFLFPLTATSFYRYNNGNWELVYEQEFTLEEKSRIYSAFEKTFAELSYKHPEKIYGELIEDRGSQITFSVLGQESPLEFKEEWNRKNPDIRSKMEKILQKHLSDMEVKVAGLSSIDVTHKGIDKEYGLRQMEKYLEISLEDMLFVGDNFAKEGNDEAALRTSMPCFEVKGVADTKKLIKYLSS